MALTLDSGSELLRFRRGKASQPLLNDAIAKLLTAALTDLQEAGAHVACFSPLRPKSARLVTIRRLRVLALPPEGPGSEGAHHHDRGDLHQGDQEQPLRSNSVNTRSRL